MKQTKKSRRHRTSFDIKKRKQGKKRWLSGPVALILLFAVLQISMTALYAKEQESEQEYITELSEMVEEIRLEETEDDNVPDMTEKISTKEMATDMQTDDVSVQEIYIMEETEINKTPAEESNSLKESEIQTEEYHTEPDTEHSTDAAAAYRVYFEESELFSVALERTVTEYLPGERVGFRVECASEEQMFSIKAYACDKNEQAQSHGVDEIAAMIEGDDPAVILTEESEQEMHYEEETRVYWFLMPETDVVVLAEMEQTEEEQTGRDEEEVLSAANAGGDEETAVPDKFTLTCSEYPDFPKAPSSMQSDSLNLAMTSRKKVIFYEDDGTKTSRIAYCIQPAANSPGSGDVYDKDQAVELTGSTAKNKTMIKALYYLYGGPAWGKDVEYADGSGSVNLKELLNNNGKDCTTNDQYYCVTHYVLSYIYQGENGQWNYMYTTEPVADVLNDHGVSTVKKIAKELTKLPLPATQLSKDKVTASYSQDQGVSVSQTIQYKTNAENTGKITLPGGVVLVNETTGERFTGMAVVSGGDKFHLEASGTVSGEQEYTVKTTYATDFTAMKLVKGGDHQDVGFSYYSGDKSLSFEVEWPENGRLSIQKTDAETKKSVPYNGNYEFSHAVYGVYYDALCTQKAAQLTTDSKGYAETDLPLGTYYVKELAAPSGFLLDTKIYEVRVDTSGGAIKVELEDAPIKKRIMIKKKDAQTGEFYPQTSQASFEGAEYTICKDARCSEVVETLVTDKNGEAISSDLRLAEYYVKETRAPKGYLPDSSVHKVEMNQKDTSVVYEVISGETIIRGSLALMKYLDDGMEESVLQDLYDAGTLENIRFELVHEDSSVAPVTITTDRYGYAATQRKELIFGTWYLSEDPETTPKGYQGIKHVKVEIAQEGAEQMYVVTNKPYEAYLCVQKKDRDSGSLVTENTAKFQILDNRGKAVRMPTFDGYTDTFTTNEIGEIHLTKSLKGGTYTLVEREAPKGYELASPITFEVGENTVFEEPLVLVCEDTPKKGRVSITKVDQNTGEHCGAGFVFQVTAKDDIQDGSGNVRTEILDGEEKELKAGTVVDTIFTDEKGMAMSRELYLGSYLIQEIQPGEYYANNSEKYEAVLKDTEDGDPTDPIIADMIIENHKTSLLIKKLDSQQNTAMAGVTFRLWEKVSEDGADENGQEQTEKEAEGTTDQNGTLQFDNLKHNTTYCLQEKATLPGYVLDNTIYEIMVDENGYIYDQAVYEMKLTNTANVVEISKQDIAGGEELPGAALTISDKDGNVVDQWISGTTPHRIIGLRADWYTLTEVTAPKGYDVAESILFELTDSLEIQKVIMIDQPLEEGTEMQTEVETEVTAETETGERETSKKHQDATDQTVPKTGDRAPITGVLSIAGLCVFAGGCSLLRLKKRNTEKK